MSNIMANPNLWERTDARKGVTDNWDGESYLFDARGGGYQVGMRNISYSLGDMMAYRIEMIEPCENLPGSYLQMTRNGAGQGTLYPYLIDHVDDRSNVFFVTDYEFVFILETLAPNGSATYPMKGGFFKITPLSDGDEFVSAFWTDQVLCKDR